MNGRLFSLKEEVFLGEGQAAVESGRRENFYLPYEAGKEDGKDEEKTSTQFGQRATGNLSCPGHAKRRMGGTGKERHRFDE